MDIRLERAPHALPFKGGSASRLSVIGGQVRAGDRTLCACYLEIASLLELVAKVPMPHLFAALHCNKYSSNNLKSVTKSGSRGSGAHSREIFLKGTCP